MVFLIRSMYLNNVFCRYFNFVDFNKNQTYAIKRLGNLYIT